MHALELARRAAVDRYDLRVRVRAAQDCAMQHAGQVQVVDVGTLALEQFMVFGAGDALADIAHITGCCALQIGYVHRVTPWLRLSPRGSPCAIRESVARPATPRRRLAGSQYSGTGCR